MTVIVTKLRREDHGELEANLTIDGDTVPVTRRCGSWMIPLGGGRYREILTAYTFELAARARPFERAEQRARAEPKDPPAFSELRPANLSPLQKRKEELAT